MTSALTPETRNRAVTPISPIVFDSHGKRNQDFAIMSDTNFQGRLMQHPNSYLGCDKWLRRSADTVAGCP